MMSDVSSGVVLFEEGSGCCWEADSFIFLLSFASSAHFFSIFWQNAMSFGRAFRGDVGDGFVSYAIKDRVLNRIFIGWTAIFAYINTAPVSVVRRASLLKANVRSVGLKAFTSRLLICFCVS